MPLDDQDLRYLDAKFDGLREATALLLAPINRDMATVQLAVFGDGNGRKGLIRILDGFLAEFKTYRGHKHLGMVSLDRKTVVSIVTIAAAIAGLVASTVSIWPTVLHP